MKFYPFERGEGFSHAEGGGHKKCMESLLCGTLKF